tara:strand:- start:1952 stop:2689 length:738 start_codon:yes stop_codon:yes gene_type:complete
MNLKNFIFFFIVNYLVLSVQSKSDIIYEIIKIPNLEIYKLETNNKLKYLYAKKAFNIGLNNNIVCKNSSITDLNTQYKIIKNELDKYSKKFLKKINLKYIVLCENLFVSGINTAGIPNGKMKTLIIDIKFNKKYFKRSIHHEVFHIIENTFDEIFNERIWSDFNDKNFSYSECSTCTKKLGLDTYLRTSGFLTEYSKSIASEDMAEVFSHIMIDKNLTFENDAILKNKINFIKMGIYKVDKNFQF